MKGSFLIKASDLLAKNSIFHGAVVLKIDDVEYLEKGVLFLTPKGFNIRFLLKTSNMQEAEVFTVFLGTSFNNNSLKYYEEGVEENIKGIFCFNFDLSKNNKKENNFFTDFHYPNNKVSYYYVSSLAKHLPLKINHLALIKTFEEIKIFIFDSSVVIDAIDKNFNWKLSLVSKEVLERGLNKINDAFLEVYKPNWVFYKKVIVH